MKEMVRWVVLGALFVIPFVPLYVAESMFFPFITGKAFAFRILVEIAFAGWVVLALADKVCRPRFSWTLVLYGAFAAWMFLANLLAVNPHKAFWSNFERMDGWVTLIHVFMFFVVAGAMLAKETTRTAWWRAFIIGSALVSGVALLQVMGVLTINQGGLRVDATFGNAIYFAVYLMFALGVTLWQAALSKGWLRYVLIAFAALQMILLLLTASRGAIIATFGAAAFAAAWAAWRMGGKTRKMAVGALIALVVVVGGFYLLRNTPVVQGEPVIARLATVFSIGEELRIRFITWDMAFKGTLERPITGWGQDGFIYIFNKHYDPSLYTAEPYYDRAHNTYLDWLVAGGIPAALLFIALLLSAVIALLRSNLPREERLLLLSLLVGYGIQALVVFDNLFTYLPLAIVLATAHIASSRPVRAIEAAPTVQGNLLGSVVAPVATVVAVAVIWVVNVPNIAAANDLIRALSPASSVQVNIELFKKTLSHGSFATQEIRENLAAFAGRVAAEPSVSNETKIEILTLAVTEMNKEIERAPNDARLLLERAAVFQSAGAYEDALASIDQVLALSPNKQTVHLSKASTLWAMGDREGARVSFRTAYELDPSFDEPYLYMVATEIIDGNQAAADTLLTERFGTSTIDHDLLWNAYAQAKRYDRLIAVQQLRIENRGGDPLERLTLARIYAVAGRIAEARAEIQATVAEHPEVAAEGAALLSQLSGAQ